MSAMSCSTRILARRSGCLLIAATTWGNTHGAFRQCTRHVTTAAKPRATKKAATASEDTVATTKKSLSTKSPATASTKTPRKKKADAAAPEPPATENIAVTPKKSTRAASTKTAAAAPKKRFTEVKTTPTPTPTESKPISARHYQPRPFPASRTEGATPPPPKPVDVKSPEYKQAARKWTSLMVALPILVVSSYYLFDRLALGNEPKGLEALRKKTSSPPSPQPKTPEH
ncbi:hypothetical protein QBC34DRAFT_428893 [Podospora aff. communis PSN243]|uniref:Uncharacterized protein n=1 Tax=Podospora aff. communis PSN243 TaxID=3040156 RepID=A0AAV9GAR6_9PEZI|nr:hypothetical protein QBC34DRAFT_428893 [Podospora aff. communis PSN243]